jgi:hypothetical protein
MRTDRADMTKLLVSHCTSANSLKISFIIEGARVCVCVCVCACARRAPWYVEKIISLRAMKRKQNVK